MDIPADIVVRGYIPNIYNNERIISGTELENDMIVLIEDDLHRGTPTIDIDARRVLENNRWCKVTNLHFSDIGESGSLANFTGEYSNGDIIVRKFNCSYAWIVKTESIGEDIQPGVSFLAFARTTPARDEDRGIFRTYGYLEDDTYPRDDTDEEDLPTFVGEVDPELERLIAEEEEIERNRTNTILLNES